MLGKYDVIHVTKGRKIISQAQIMKDFPNHAECFNKTSPFYK